MSTITLIIILATCCMYLFDRIPVALATAFGMLAMVFAGVLSYGDAFANFGSNPVMLTFGMMVIVNAIMDSGAVGDIEAYEFRVVKTEKGFVVILFVTAALISFFTNNSALVAISLPLLSALSRTSGGRVTRKNTFLPLAMGGLIGGTGSLAGSTAPLLASDVLEMTGNRPFSFFSTAPVALCIIGAIAVCYWLFLYRYQKRCFDFEETSETGIRETGAPKLNKRNAILSISVFLICVALFIIQPFNWPLGLIAVTGAAVLIALGCVDGKKALRDMQWSALITLGAALAIAEGFVKSGAGDVVIDWLLAHFGAGMVHPPVLVAVFLVIGWFLSLFMANGSLVSMLAAIAIPMAMELGQNPIPAAMACVFGASLAMATPVATTTITMVQVVGYRFKDYLKIGGLVGLIGLATAWLSICLLYGLF